MNEEISIPRETSDTLVKIMHSMAELEKSYFNGQPIKRIFNSNKKALTTVITGANLITDCDNLHKHLKTRSLSFIKNTFEDMLNSLISYKAGLNVSISKREDRVKRSSNELTIYYSNAWLIVIELGLSHIDNFYKVLFETLHDIERNSFMNGGIGVDITHLEKVNQHGIDFITSLAVLARQLETNH